MTADVKVRGEYNGVAKLLHWLVVALLVAQFTVAWSMPDIHHDSKPTGLIAWHLSIGASILFVMLVRLFWRARGGVPPAPTDIPVSLRLLSRATHFLLYGILIVLPFLGWATANAHGWTVRLFGFIPLPHLVASGSPAGKQLGAAHGTLALVLLGVAGLHILGALYHQVILRDGLLRRVVPGMGQS